MKYKVLFIVGILILGLGITWYFKHDTLNTFFASSFSQKLDLLTPSEGLPGVLQKFTGDRIGELTAGEVVELTNKERGLAGLPPLTVNTMLTSSATAKTDDMITKQYFEHVSPDGRGPSDLAKSAGYDYILVGENLAVGNFASSAELVTGWMNSPGHRANILNSKYTEIGVSVKKAQYQGNTVWFAVQEFGTPRSSCPAVNSNLKTTIDANQAEIDRLTTQANFQKQNLQSGVKNSQADYDAYNALVEQINTLIEKTKILVKQYNDQVTNFNTCLGT